VEEVASSLLPDGSRDGHDWQLEVLARRREGEYLNKIIDYLLA
jgi:hypothetical protein